MSLINRMLRDLDAREASELERAALGPKVRPLPARPSRRWPLATLSVSIVLAALAGGGAAWWLLQHKVPPPRLAEAPPMPALVIPLPAEADGAMAEHDGSPCALRMEAGLSRLPETATSPATPRQRPPAPADVAAFPAAPEAKVSPEGTALPINAAPSTGETAAEGHIARQTHGGPAQEAADGEYRRALNLLRRGAGDQALAALESALSLAPGHASARQALLALLVERRQFEQAASVARSGLALDPAQSGWAMILARLQVEEGDLAGASATLARHAPAVSQSASADYAAFRAHLHYRLEEFDSAIALYRAALAQRPGEGRWWYGLGLALAANKQSDEANIAFRQARDSGTLPPELLKMIELRLK